MSFIAVNGDTAPPRAEPGGSTLRTRLLAALVLAPVTLALVAAGGWPFAGFVALGGLLLAREWSELTGQGGRVATTVVLAAAAVAAPFLVVGGAGGYAWKRSYETLCTLWRWTRRTRSFN